MIVCLFISISFVTWNQDIGGLTYFFQFITYRHSVAWLVLLMEIISEIYIRPDNYRALLQSDKAYAPSTVRYINNFHIIFELVALFFVIPDFLPLFGYDIVHVTFPEGAINATGRRNEGDLIAGKLYFLLLHLRIFGLIRHLRNHWIRWKDDSENHSSHSGGAGVSFCI